MNDNELLESMGDVLGSLDLIIDESKDYGNLILNDDQRTELNSIKQHILNQMGKVLVRRNSNLAVSRM